MSATLARTRSAADKRFGDWMQTYTGRQFWPMDPRAEDVDIEDIAHSLSMQCRYAGHCKRFYSVAEHSVILSLHVPSRHALWALLHDASEAYLVDVPRPVKPYLMGYDEAEECVMEAICERFGLSPEMPREVKQADGRILNDERAALMSKPPAEWSYTGEPLGVQIYGFNPESAKLAFLHRFRELTGAASLDDFKAINMRNSDNARKGDALAVAVPVEAPKLPALDDIAKAISGVGYPEHADGDGFAWRWHPIHDHPSNLLAHESREEDREKARRVLALFATRSSSKEA